MANTTTKATTTRSSKTAPDKKPPKTGATLTRKARTKSSTTTHEISPDLRQQMIAEAAYLRAEQRGFGPGDPLDDWLSAEREVDMLLAERTHHIAQ